MAESAIGLYKTELSRRHGPWGNPEQVEIAPLKPSTGSTTEG
jgi:hypothetical protein